MQPPSADQLITLLTQCEESSEEERDELLRDFLVHGVSHPPDAGRLARRPGARELRQASSRTSRCSAADK